MKASLTLSLRVEQLMVFWAVSKYLHRPSVFFPTPNFSGMKTTASHLGSLVRDTLVT